MNWMEFGMMMIYAMHCNGNFADGDIKADQFWKDVWAKRLGNPKNQ